MIIFEQPRDATAEALYRWAVETAEKLNRMQEENERSGENGTV